jgi:hypothetical protein
LLDSPELALNAMKAPATAIAACPAVRILIYVVSPLVCGPFALRRLAKNW